MELNEFITNSLVEIATGIKNANVHLKDTYFEIEPYRRDKETGFVSFDLAVKTNDSKVKGTKGGIQVLNVGVGGNFDNTSTKEVANRIKFYILPVKGVN